MSAPADRDSASPAGWEAALGDLESLIDRQRAALDGGGPADDGALGRLVFTAPSGLPALPAEMAARARRALAATTALATRAREMSDRSQPAVPNARTVRRAAATFDRRV